MIDELLGALSWPQRKAKEAISGTEEEWFSPDGMDPRLYAAGNVALDLVADPLNLLGAGLFRRGGQALKALGIDSKAGRGMLTANLDNYINDFYGTGGRELTKLEKAINPVVKKVKPDIPSELVGDASAKIVNTAGTLLTGGGKALKSLVSPSDRALWKETGISKGGQDVIKGHLTDPTAQRAQAKAVAEANYQLHNAFQGGRKGATHSSLEGIGTKSNLETYTKNEPGTITKWMDKHAGSTLDPVSGKYVPVKMDPADAKYIEDHVMRDWKGSDGLVMKKPASKQAGDHRNDALSAKNPSVGGINRAFKALDKAGKPKTVDNLYDELVTQKGVRGKAVQKDKRLANYTILGKDETGVWLRTNKAGSAITEGGVNILTKVKPDGEYFSVVSDKHDFLEKTPLLGRAVQSYLPNDLVAVTPPMYAHVYRKPVQLASGKKGKSPYRLTSSELKNPKGTPTWMEDLEGIASARPSKEAVRAEQMRSAGMLLPLVNESTKE